MVSTVSIPPIIGDAVNIEFITGTSTVFVGANGSGKSRLGSYIDKKLNDKAYRIPAQKNLQFTQDITITTLEDALQELRYGHKSWNAAHKENYKPITGLLSNYDKLLRALFSENSEAAIEYLNTTNETPKPITALGKIVDLWERVLPHRKLIVSNCKIEIIPNSGKNAYSPTQLSDGERVIFYQIGHCLLAPPNCVVIVDEPELHLHKSVIRTLWDEIESSRPDCTFVYITHDLDFAKSRAASQKYAVQEYDSDRWSIIEVPYNDYFPEVLVTKILGSRSPILFVEGEGDSIDMNMYGKIYPKYTVIPVTGAEIVIHSVETFNKQQNLHHFQCAGLIDRDDRDEKVVAYLEAKRIYPIQFTEIENSLLDEHVMSIVLNDMKFTDADSKKHIAAAKEIIFNTFEKDIDQQCLKYTKRQIDNLLKKIDLNSRDINTLDTAVSSSLSGFSASKIFEQRKLYLQGVLANQDYQELIRIYENKGLAHLLKKQLGAGYQEHALRILKSNESSALTSRLRELLPNSPDLVGYDSKKNVADAA